MTYVAYVERSRVTRLFCMYVYFSVLLKLGKQGNFLHDMYIHIFKHLSQIFCIHELLILHLVVMLCKSMSSSSSSQVLQYCCNLSLAIVQTCQHTLGPYRHINRSTVDSKNGGLMQICGLLCPEDCSHIHQYLFFGSISWGVQSSCL